VVRIFGSETWEACRVKPAGFTISGLRELRRAASPPLRPAWPELPDQAISRPISIAPTLREPPSGKPRNHVKLLFDA